MMPLGMVALTINHHHMGPQGAKIAIDVGETKGLPHLSSPHLPETMGLRETGVYYQWLPQCHLGPIGQTDPSIPNKGEGNEGMELI